MIVFPLIIAGWERYKLWRQEQADARAFANQSAKFGNATETHYNMGFEPPEKIPDADADQKHAKAAFIVVTDSEEVTDMKTLRKRQRESKQLGNGAPVQGEFVNPMFAPKDPSSSEPLPGRPEEDEAGPSSSSKRRFSLQKGPQGHAASSSNGGSQPNLKASYIDMTSGSTDNLGPGMVVANSPYSLTTKRKQKKISEDLAGFTEEETFENPLFAKAQEEKEKKNFIVMN